MSTHPHLAKRSRWPRLLAPWIGAVALAASVAVAGCGGDSDKGTGGSGGGKTYTIATSADFPPMSFRASDDPNKVVGFEVDMLGHVIDRMGAKYKLITSDFNGLIPSAQSGRVDAVMSDVYDTAERRKVVDFVDYLKNSFAVMVAGSKAGGVHSYNDLCGKSIGVLTGSAPELEIARAASKSCTKAGKPAMTIRSYPAVSQELPQLDNGSLDSILEEWTSLAYIAKKAGGKYVVAFPDPHTTNVGFVVKKGSALKAKLQSAVQQYIRSPQYKQDAQKWGIPARSLLPPSAT
ncbi:MAG: ABC transporter substrate-binding protein [Solirubrobacteraceae bacterium]|jgi:polar amino acid transport system substrate-binding protein